jgi:hypothetical protein
MMDLYPSFYNSIDVPTENQQLAWPDLLSTRTNDESSEHMAMYLDLPPAAAGVSVPSLDRNHQRIEELKSKEQLYRETLQKLYKQYNPGNALGEVHQVEESVRDELLSIDDLLEKSVLKVEDLFCALSLKDKYQNVLHHCSILESEELYHMDDVRKKKLWCVF